MTAKITYVTADRLMSTSSLIVTGMAILLLSLAMFTAIAIALAALLTVTMRGASTATVLGILLPLSCLGAALPARHILRTDRQRIATTNRAAMLAAGAALGAVIPVGATLFVVGLLDSNVNLAIFWPFGVTMCAFGWVMANWSLLRLSRGAICVIGDGDCLGCGYDLTGNESGVCSECGSETATINAERGASGFRADKSNE